MTYYVERNLKNASICDSCTCLTGSTELFVFACGPETNYVAIFVCSALTCVDAYVSDQGLSTACVGIVQTVDIT